MATARRYLNGKEAEEMARQIEQYKTVSVSPEDMKRIQELARQYKDAPSIREAHNISREMFRVSKDVKQVERALRDAERARKAAGL